MTQKELFSQITEGTVRGINANISLARALTKSTGSGLTFTYDVEAWKWSATGDLERNNTIRYKTPDNQPIGLKRSETYMAQLGLTIANPMVGEEQFDESTGEWVARYQEDITAMGGNLTTSLANPLIVQVNEAGTTAVDAYLTSVTLPTSLTTLDMSTLAYVSGLTNLTIPYSVTSITGNAFTTCYNLTGITYPGTMAEWQGEKVNLGSDWAYDTPIYAIECSDGKVYRNTVTVNYTTTDGNAITFSSEPFVGRIVDHTYTSTGGTIVVGKIGNNFSVKANAFDGQDTLQSITLPSSTTSIGIDAFRLCHKLTGITIPSSVIEIKDYAFHACTGLTSFTLPDTVTSVGVGTLYACTGITDPVYNNKIFVTMRRDATGSYTVPDGIETIAGGAFQWHTGLSSITLPSSLKSIGAEAFNNCNSLANLTIPAAVTNMGGSMFDGCSSMSTMHVLSNDPPNITNTTLTGLPEGCSIFVPENSLDTYRERDLWSARAEHIWPIM